MAITLAQLRARVQVLYDIAGSAVLATSEWNQLINDAQRALWADVTAINKDFRVTPQAFTISTGQTFSISGLSPGFREVRAVLRDPGTSNQVYLPRFGPRVANQTMERSYRIQGTTLYIEPLPRATGTYQLLYVPQATDLVADGDTVDVELEPFQDYLVYYPVTVALSREESDASQFMGLLEQVKTRVKRWSSDQRSADPDTVEDVRRSEPWFWTPP